jgi:hypothetical protein
VSMRQARRRYRYLFLLVVGLLAVLLIGMDWSGANPQSAPPLLYANVPYNSPAPAPPRVQAGQPATGLRSPPEAIPMPAHRLPPPRLINLWWGCTSTNSYGFNPCLPFSDRVVGLPN